MIVVLIFVSAEELLDSKTSLEIDSDSLQVK